MTSTNRPDDRQNATLPPVIRREKDGAPLQMTRRKRDGAEIFELFRGEEVIHVFSAWQYHVLCALFSFGGDKYSSLLVNVNDRFGSALNKDDIKSLFRELREEDLFDEAEVGKHPLLAAFAAGSDDPADETPATGPAEEERQSFWKTQHLMDPTPFLRKISPFLGYGRYLAYPIPFLLFAALLIMVQHEPVEAEDVSLVTSGLHILGGVLLGLFTINLMAVMTAAAVAYNYGATVSSVSIVWFYGFIPRFVLQYEDTEKFSRAQKMWLYGAPLLMRLGIFSICTILWYYGSHMQGALPDFFATLSFMAWMSFMVTACPFLRGSGYAMMAEYLEEPELREKAFLALLNKYKKNIYAKIDSTALAAYALVCSLFIVALGVAVLLMLHTALRFEIGSESIAVVLALCGFIGYKVYVRFRQINESYEKKRQYERWRKRVLPDEQDTQKEAEKKKKAPLSLYKKLAIVSVALALLSPYPYRASGTVTLVPASKQPVSTDIAGIVEEVYYDGGETLAKGTVIARLSVKDPQAQLEIARGKLAEQQAYIDQLRAMPTEEDISVAEQRLEVARVQWTYSNAKCDRQQILYDSGAISLDELESVRKDCMVDLQKKDEAEAELVKVMAGASPEQIATAESALQTVQAQISMYEDQISRSAIVMPFDGRLSGIGLKDRKGDFLERGTPFAEAEDDSTFRIELKVPETDAPHIHSGAAVDIRLAAQPGRVFRGAVEGIDTNVESRSYGKTVKIIATLENRSNELKSGMSGYAKVSGDTQMMVQVLTGAVYRFFTVEMWAWIP